RLSVVRSRSERSPAKRPAPQKDPTKKTRSRSERTTLGKFPLSRFRVLGKLLLSSLRGSRSTEALRPTFARTNHAYSGHFRPARTPIQLRVLPAEDRRSRRRVVPHHRGSATASAVVRVGHLRGWRLYS